MTQGLNEESHGLAGRGSQILRNVGGQLFVSANEYSTAERGCQAPTNPNLAALLERVQRDEDLLAAAFVFTWSRLCALRSQRRQLEELALGPRGGQ